MLPRKCKDKTNSTFLLRPIKTNDYEGYIDCLNSVANEGIYFLHESFDISKKQFIQKLKKFKERGGLIGIVEREENPDDKLQISNKKIKSIIGEFSVNRGAFSKNRHTCHLQLSIKKDYRGIGIGSAIMKYVIDWAKQQGCKKMTLAVFSSNENAIALYKKFGFEIEGIKKNELLIQDKYVDEILMAKWL